MKISISSLKKIINEIGAPKFTRKKPMQFDKPALTVYVTPVELESIVSMAKPTEIRNYDYVDIDTGEVLWIAGTPASECRLSAYYQQQKAEEKAAMDQAYAEEQESWAAEDAAYEQEKEAEREHVFREFTSAMKQYAEDARADAAATYGNDIENYAVDLAQAFLHTYPWQQAARKLGMSKEDVLSAIADMIVG